MFGKIAKYIVLLAVIVAISIWFAENPGVVSIEWQGLIIDVPIALALIAALLFVGVCAILYRVWLFVRRSPKAYGHYRSEKRLHNGYDALTKGLVAVAAGDTNEARKHARKADSLLEDPSLTMLLSAQAAQLDGDDQAATKFFEEMSMKKGMEFLGLRGLLNQAIARGDTDEALKLAKQAYALKPKTQWLATNLFELQLEKGEWAEAEATLNSSVKHKLVDQNQGKRHKGVLMTERAHKAVQEGQSDSAIKLLQQALKQDATLVAAAVELAKLLERANKRRKAYSVLEEAWGHNPHPDLYDLYQELHGEPDALKRVTLAQKLVQKNRDHVESRFALAKASLEAEIWGEARKELDVLVKEAPTARVFGMMAELEESEHNDLSRAREWLRKATQAESDPAWVCNTCGDATTDWSAVCSKCHDFDTKNWKSPSRARTNQIAQTVEAELIESPAAQ